MEQDVNVTSIVPQGIVRAAYKHTLLEIPQFSQCFPKQNSGVNTDCLRASGISKDFIHSCRFTPLEKSLCQRNLQADQDVALTAPMVQPLFSAASHHKPAPPALVAELLLSPASQKSRMCKQSQGVFTGLPAPTKHIHTFCYQTAKTRS